MVETIIKLDKVGAASGFANLIGKISGDVTLYSGKYVVDGKSIMGIYSLDLTKPIKMEINGEIPDEVKESMKQYIVWSDCYEI